MADRPIDGLGEWLVRLCRDAERYRWLRGTNERPFRTLLFDKDGGIGVIDCIMVQDQESSAIALSAHEMDEAIDAAMERWPA